MALIFTGSRGREEKRGCRREEKQREDRELAGAGSEGPLLGSSPAEAWDPGCSASLDTFCADLKCLHHK